MTVVDKIPNKELVKKTLYITKEQSKVLGLIKAMENKNEYEVTIEALTRHLNDTYSKYLKIANDEK